MSKKETYSEAALKAKADSVFGQFPKAESVFATTDGNVFLDRNRAELHAKKGRVVQVDRPLPTPEAPAEPKMNTKDAIAAILKATLEELAVFAADDRKTVQEAYQKRLEELGINNNEQ